MASSNASTPTKIAPTKVTIPDFESHCNSSFVLRTNPHWTIASPTHDAWLLTGLGDISERKKIAYSGLKAGLLTSMCYPDAPLEQLQVCCDFMGWLFALDDITDDMDMKDASSIGMAVMNALYHPFKFANGTRLDRMTRDYRTRMERTVLPGALQRFQSTMDLFFQAVRVQALDRRAGYVLDLESYKSLRRDTSGCKPCWALIEYANGLQIPDEVMEHPSLVALGEATNDLVTWSNDVFSYNVEQSRGDTHNMIVVVMQEQGLGLQSAVDFVGDMCKASINRFVKERAAVPSWGPEIDEDVGVYINGLAAWIIGSLQWSYLSTRYFGDKGLEIKKTCLVELLPRKEVC